LLQLVQHGITLQGGGHIVLSDSDGNVISGTGSEVTLLNVDNTISGAGHLGAGQLSLVNEGAIVANGSNALEVDTGANTILNHGTLEATGAGGLVVQSAVDNSGLLWANGGNLVLNGTVSGAGSALISGAGTLEVGGTGSLNVTFDATASGLLKLDHFDFSGVVSGFDGNDKLDFVAVDFGAGTSVSFAVNGSGTGGTLSVSDGVHTASVDLLGVYAADSFATGTDGQGGTLVNFSDPYHLT
jgi:hypothetical protein